MNEIEELPPSASLEAPRPEPRVSQRRALITAVQFLTRLPLSSTSHASPAALQQCVKYFPLVGTLVGGLAAGVLAGSLAFWPVWLAVLLALAAEALLTGALHEDGLADFADAFGGGWTREQTLAILKDSRIGTYGALALLLYVLLRAGALVTLLGDEPLNDWPLWVSPLVASVAIGRWTLVLGMWALPPVADRESLSRSMSRELGVADLAWATFFMSLAAAPWVYLQPANSSLALLLIALAMGCLLRLIRRRLGGISGDCLGCLACVTQLLVLLAAAADLKIWIAP